MKCTKNAENKIVIINVRQTRNDAKSVRLSKVNLHKYEISADV